MNIELCGGQNERRGQKDLAKRSRDKSVSQRAQETAADIAGPDNAAQTEGGEQDLFPAAKAEDRASADWKSGH